MLTTYTRPFSDEEIKTIEGRPPSRFDRIERIVNPARKKRILKKIAGQAEVGDNISTNWFF